MIPLRRSLEVLILTDMFYSKIDFVLQRTFYPAAAAAKVSILIWYTSLFTMKVFVYIAWGEIILVLSWALAATVWGLVTCQPVSYLWDGLASSTSTTTAGGYCSDADPLTADLTFAVWDVATSVAILVLPMVVLPRLPRRLLSMWRRAAVLALFLLGSLACIIGGVRISAIYQHHEALRPRLDDEYTNSEAYLATWIVIEVHAAILSSNLPCLAPLFPCLRVRDSEGDDESFIGVGDPERAWPKSSSNNQSNNSNGSARRPTVRFADEYPLLHYPLPPIHTGGPIWQPGDFRSRGRATDGSTRSDHRMEYSRKTSTVEVIPVSSGSE